MKFSVAPVSNNPQARVIPLLTGKRGLYSGELPNLDVFRVENSKSDVVLCPHNLKSIEKDLRYLDLLEEISKKKPVMILNFGDFPRKHLRGNFIHLQTSHEIGLRYEASRTIIVPLNARVLNLEFRSYKDTPELAFVGQVPSISPGRIVRSVLPTLPNPMQWMTPHPFKRNSALIRKVGSYEIFNFGGTVIPRKFHSGTAADVSDTASNRGLYEFILNQSDIFFCPRGDANASLRLYETIAAGRIPLIPTTSVFMPDLGGNYLDGLTIKCATLSQDLRKRVEIFWADLNEKKYLHVQNQLRELYARKLKFSIYFENLFRRPIDEILSQRPLVL